MPENMYQVLIVQAPESMLFLKGLGFLEFRWLSLSFQLKWYQGWSDLREKTLVDPFDQLTEDRQI